MFSSGMRESWETEIQIPSTAYHIFHLLLEFLYTDQIPMDTVSLGGEPTKAKCQWLIGNRGAQLSR
jgi:hypothetical protein